MLQPGERRDPRTVADDPQTPHLGMTADDRAAADDAAFEDLVRFHAHAVEQNAVLERGARSDPATFADDDVAFQTRAGMDARASGNGARTLTEQAEGNIPVRYQIFIGWSDDMTLTGARFDSVPR